MISELTGVTPPAVLSDLTGSAQWIAEKDPTPGGGALLAETAAAGPGVWLVTTTPTNPGLSTRAFSVGGDFLVLVDEAIALYGADVEMVPYNYVITIAADSLEMYLEDPGGITRFAAGSSFTLINQAMIYGQGGGGGNPFGIGQDGEPGGNALELNGNAVTIDNGAGDIFGGGGGGGNGEVVQACIENTLPSTNTGYAWLQKICGGAGGGGAGNGVAGVPLYVAPVCAIYDMPAPTGPSGAPVVSASAVGTANYGVVASVTITTVAANGGTGTTVPGTASAPSDASGSVGFPVPILGSAVGGTAGDGGDWGQAGQDGAAGAVNGNYAPLTSILLAAGVGGAAGKAINLNGGTAVFTAGNNAAQVKGAVS